MQSLDSLYEYCRSYDIPCISHETRVWLESFLQTHKPHHIVEIGSAAGYSSLVMASAVSERGGHITSCEISRPQYKKCLHHQKLFRQYDTIQYYHIDATNQNHWEAVAPQSIDFAFIDGAKASYQTFVNHILPYMKVGKSHILCDDVLMYHNKISPLYTYLSEMQIQYQTIKLDDGDGLLLISL